MTCLSASSLSNADTTQKLEYLAMADQNLLNGKTLLETRESVAADSGDRVSAPLSHAEETRERQASKARVRSAVHIHPVKSGAAFWTSTVLPTLAIVLTTATLLVQRFEKKIEERTEQDSQWMTAVEHIPDTQTVASIEMEPFFHQQQHGPIARAIAARTMSSIPDHTMFDLLFATFTSQEGGQDQTSLIILARSLTSQLRDQYTQHKHIVPAKIDDCGSVSSFQLFLADSECFYDKTAPADFENLVRVESLEWELDTVVDKLVQLWTNPQSPQPPGKDLEAIAFFSVHRKAYKAADFRNSDLENSGFYGDCDMSGAIFDAKIDASRKHYVYCKTESASPVVQARVGHHAITVRDNF